MVSIEDRGPAKYFHGRKGELQTFADQLTRSRATKGGTTYLVQGPPGVGKSALLHECEQSALRAGWRVAVIATDALFDIAALRRDLHQRLRGLRDLKEVRVGPISVSLDYTSNILEVLPAASGNQGLVLSLDEVQHLQNVESEHSGTVERVLAQIHNGKLGAPVMLLSGGLGHSETAFNSLGISRFKSSCLINLASLSKEAERAVIRDFLTKDGGAHKGPELDRWVDAIAKETHGWPQHIIAYAQLAAEHIRSQRGTLAGLHYVLEQGRSSQRAYYCARTNEVDHHDEYAARDLGILAHMCGTRQSLGFSHIMARLKQKRTRGEAKYFFDALITKGILSKAGPNRYTIPIPSMRTWLVDTYFQDQSVYNI